MPIYLILHYKAIPSLVLLGKQVLTCHRPNQRLVLCVETAYTHSTSSTILLVEALNRDVTNLSSENNFG